MSTNFVRADLPQLTATEPFEFDSKTQVITAKGGAQLTSEYFALSADQIHLNRETFEAKAKGNIALNKGGIRFVSSHLKYNFIEQQIETDTFKLGSPPFYLKGAKAEGSFSKICIENPILYFGEPDCLTVNICAKDVQIIKCETGPLELGPVGLARSTVIARHAFLRLGKIPLFYLPYFKHRLEEIPIHFNASLGANKRSGSFAKARVLVTNNPQFKWGASMDYYSKSSFLLGPALEYCANLAPGQKIVGSLNSGYINDKACLGKDALKRPIKKDRFFIELEHQQTFSERLKLTGQVRVWSDSEVLRDFRPEIFNHNQDPDNFFELVYKGPNYFLSAFSRFRVNDFQLVQERLPELRFDLMPTRVFNSPFFHHLNASVTRLKEKNPFQKDKPILKSHRFDLFYGVDWPVKLSSCFLLKPVLGVRLTQYSDFNFLRGQVGFDAQWNFYGLWDYKNDFWCIDGLRHVIRPIVQYRYLPLIRSASSKAPPLIERNTFNKNGFSTNIQPLDLAYDRRLDEVYEEHVVRLGVENLLQTRDCCYGSRELAYLNTYIDYRLQPIDKKQRRFSDLYTEMAIKPAYWIDFGAYFRLNVEDFTLKELRTELRLKDGNSWALYIATDNLHRKINQLYIGYDLHLTPLSLFFANWRYDHKLESITKQTYGYKTRLCNSWQIETSLTHSRGNKRKGHWEVSLVATLLPFDLKILPITL